MPRFDDPDLFTTGTVGPPGQRVFYLQASGDGALTAVRLEKQQVAALAEYLQGMLQELPAPPGSQPAPSLVEPIEPRFVVGNIGVAYDNERDRIVIVAEEFTEDDADTDELRVDVSRAQAQAFIERAEMVLAGGRPPCRLCGAPVDPGGHACPRHN